MDDLAKYPHFGCFYLSFSHSPLGFPLHIIYIYMFEACVVYWLMSLEIELSI